MSKPRSGPAVSPINRHVGSGIIRGIRHYRFNSQVTIRPEIGEVRVKFGGLKTLKHQLKTICVMYRLHSGFFGGIW
jgi:hypothetical protein